MGIMADKFTFCEKQANSCTFSLKSASVVSADDFFALPDKKYAAGEWITFKAVDCSKWQVAAVGVYSLSITIADKVFQTVKQAVYRAVRVCKKFAYSNLCRGCRVVPMVPMALRL